MKILEYDYVDLVGVFHLTMLALGFPLTPEHAAHIRRTDPRPFPFLAVCAVEDNVVIGHVGSFACLWSPSKGEKMLAAFGRSPPTRSTRDCFTLTGRGS